MRGYNLVVLNGNLAQDPEFKTVSNGQSMMKMRLATSKGYKTRDGEWKDRTDYHTVVVWGRQADGLLGRVQKGSRLLVHGSLSTRSWEAQDGSKRYATEVNADEVILQGGGGGAAAAGSRQEAPADSGGWDGDDDLPF